MTQPQTECQNLRGKLAKINIRYLDRLFEEYVKYPLVEQDELTAWLAGYSEFKDEFQPQMEQKAKLVVGQWILNTWVDADRRQDLISNITVDAFGRITLAKNFPDSFDLTSAKYMPSLIRKVKGDLYLGSCPFIEKVDYLEEVDGYLNADASEGLRSMKRLKTVTGDLGLQGSGITDLSGLKKVWGKLDLRQATRITGIDSLEYVGGEVRFDNVKTLVSLANLAYIGGNAVLGKTGIVSLPQLEKVEGSLSFRSTSISQCPMLYEIGKFLNIMNTGITDFSSVFPMLHTINEKIYVDNESLGEQIVELRRSGYFLTPKPLVSVIKPTNP